MYLQLQLHNCSIQVIVVFYNVVRCFHNALCLHWNVVLLLCCLFVLSSLQFKMSCIFCVTLYGWVCIQYFTQRSYNSLWCMSPDAHLIPVELPEIKTFKWQVIKSFYEVRKYTYPSIWLLYCLSPPQRTKTMHCSIDLATSY